MASSSTSADTPPVSLPENPPSPASLPERPHPLRSLFWQIAVSLTRLLFRIRPRGPERIPQSGGALLLANGLSPLDPFFIRAACPRPVRFVAHPGHFGWALRGRIARILGVISLPPESSSREWLHSLRKINEAIQAGELICLFGEGELSRVGQMLPFRRDFERLRKDLSGPIIPVALDSLGLGGVWRGSKNARLASAPPRFRRIVDVAFLPPLAPGATASAARQIIQEAITEIWLNRAPEMRPLHRAFVRTARRHPLRFAMGDARAPRLNFLNALARTLYLAQRLKESWANQEYVGILLPPSVAGALVNFAALLMGNTPVNLNYTASSDTIAACLRQCGIQTIVSSQAFLEKVPLQLPARMLLLEEIAANPRRSERLKALALALFAPVHWIERSLGRPQSACMDDRATVIFSSGSTGEPKGVVLTHFNVASNIAQLDRVYGVTGKDCFLGTLPFFHSFGFTGTLWLTATIGAGVAFHPTPLEAAAVARLVRSYSITFLLTTPTFLQLYLRGCSAEDFGSLRVVMAGAEKLPDRLSLAFEEKFGLRPLEGYGCTECAPVVAANSHDFRGPGIRQTAGRRAKIGRPLPGISARILDNETHQPLPIGEPGLLFVRGPNVMRGYLNDPKKTEEVLRDGWYCTGDIATLDQDGFLQLTDRLSRFSKIGGEMIPHIKIEETLHEIAQITERVFVVTGIPDEKKGERLIVLHQVEEVRVREIIQRLPQTALPNLWTPRANHFFRVESLPILGTGKLDLRRVREIALSLAARSEPPAE